MNAHAQQVLKDVFGYSRFKSDQRGIVDALVAGRDAAAVMPTGSGKSLCYQLPAICREGTGIVVSPLISLMKDQVDKLHQRGVRAGYLNSSLTPPQQEAVLSRLKAGRFDLLYVAPERFQCDPFARALQDVPVALFAIDEAHCISEWGHDFRPDYLKLSELRARFPGVPIAAFTATATHRTREQIVERLGLRDPHLVLASFDRPNLYYEVIPKHDDEEQIVAFVKSRGEQDSGIVYRFSRRSVENTAEYLRHCGIRALPYHAGLDTDVRRRHQDSFIGGHCQVIVATIAFGMGIDKPDVRFVVHADLPKNVEGYYQETGRAGRDGNPSHCLLLHSGADAARIHYFIGKIQDPEEQRRARFKLDAMLAFAGSTSCHRYELLRYFGEHDARRACRHCAPCAPRHAYGQTPSATRASRSRATLRATLDLLRSGLSIPDIASQRGIKPTTVTDHLAKLVDSGDFSDIESHVQPRKRRRIEELLDRFGSDRLKPIVEAADGHISYGEARIIRAARRQSELGSLAT